MLATILATSLLISALSVSAQGQNVTCRAAANCGGTNIGQMTAKDCCVNTPNARSFFNGTTCSPCIVLGFLNDSFTGEEQTDVYTVQVGYRKGNGDDIDFNVRHTPGTAREGIGYDYSVVTMTVTVQEARNNTVEFHFYSDSIAQERNESFTLRLEVVGGSTLPTGDGVFIVDEMNMVIMDNDMVEFEFTEEDFSGRERGRNPRVPVVVFKSKQIATRIVLHVVPLTVAEAQSFFLQLPTNILNINNMYSPPYADSKDFNNTVRNITFEPDENESVDEQETDIPIFDDEINEAQEQTFVVLLRLVESVNESLVRFTRQTSLCRIRDDDEITIGFEHSGYTYTEPKFDEDVNQQFMFMNDSGPIYLVKHDNVISEQTFRAIVVVADTAPSVEVSQPATFTKDYSITSTTVSLSFPSESQRILVGFMLLPDDIYEGTEGFQMSFTFEDLGTTMRIPKYSPPSTGLTRATVIIEDDDAPPLVSFEKESYTAFESQGYVEVCFNTSNGHVQPVEVEIQPVEKNVDYPALGNSDFSSSPITQTFQTSDMGNRLCANITLIDDTLYERDEQFLVTFGNLPSPDAGVGLIDETTITILDDDVPTFNIGPNITVNESTPDVEICISTTTKFARNFVVTAVTGPKSGVTNQATEDVDYNSATITLTFVPKDDGMTQMCAKVGIIDDMLGNEPDEVFSVKLVNVTSAGSAEACVTIKDDDTPVVEWAISEITIPEGESSQICFTTDIGTAVTYVVRVGASQKDPYPATSGDYEIQPSSQAITIPVSSSGGRFCVNVLTKSDDEVEENEQFLLNFSNLPSEFADIGDIDTVSVTIQDAVLPLVSFESETYTAPEDQGYVEVCFLTSKGHLQPVVVEIRPVEKNVDYPASGDSDFSSSPITQTLEIQPVEKNVDYPASRNSDFLSSPITQTFKASNMGNRLCANITLIDDDLYEGDEQFLVTFGNLPNARANVGLIDETTITIQDDDVPTFNIGPNIAVDESTPEVEICISTTSKFARNFVVTAVTGPKSGTMTNQATEDVDYESTTIMLTFWPKDDGMTQMCANVSIIDDTLGNEPDEVFSVRLSNDVTSAGNAEACVTIEDNDTPVVEWEFPEITIPEGESSLICFTTNIGTAVTYGVQIGARQRNPNPATSGDYDIQPSSQAITIPVSSSGGRFCVNVTTSSDTELEGDEQFSLHFVNLLSQFADIGDTDTVLVTIEDAGTPPPPKLMVTCLITEPLRVQPFSRNTMYGFMGTCEHTAVRSCDLIPGFNVRVNVDFLTESMENGAVGLLVNEHRYVSREDGSFDDGGQTPLTATSTHREYKSSGSRIVVNLGEGMTNITYSVINLPEDDPLFVEITVVHVYAGESPFIQVNLEAPNDTLHNFCGLCGSRYGDLVRPDGSIAQRMDLPSFVQSYLVEPREQILRPQRRECGTVRNDTVIGDPLYTVPVYNEAGKEYSLCYEVFGRTNSTLNLVSDTCVSVNARYSAMDNPELGNIISSIGVRAKGMTHSSCHNIRVDLDGCSAIIESPGSDPLQLTNMQSMQVDGISVKKYPSRVRISAPNCENVRLVTWVMCENQNNQDMLKFVIARGVNLRASSHGLLGQFWNIPVTFTKYSGTDLPEEYDPEDFYVVKVQPESGPARSFLGEFYHLTWDKSREPCLYVGTSQGGPTYEVVDPNDSVIEGHYRDYIIDDGDLFETTYKYDQFDEERC